MPYGVIGLILTVSLSGCCCRPQRVACQYQQESALQEPICPPGSVAVSETLSNGQTVYKCVTQTADVRVRGQQEFEKRLSALEQSMKGVKSDVETSKKELSSLKKSSTIMNSKLDRILKSLESLLPRGA